MNIKQITFSPTGGTRKVADAIASGISFGIEACELCTPASRLSAIRKGCAVRKKNELFI